MCGILYDKRAVIISGKRLDLSRVDRHAHIGEGKIGLAGFAEILNDPRLSNLPMILETPKGADEAGRDWDDVNAEALRALVR